MKLGCHGMVRKFTICEQWQHIPEQALYSVAVFWWCLLSICIFQQQGLWPVKLQPWMIHSQPTNSQKYYDMTAISSGVLASKGQVPGKSTGCKGWLFLHGFTKKEVWFEKVSQLWMKTSYLPARVTAKMTVLLTHTRSKRT